MEFSGILVALFKLFFLLAAGYFLNRIGMLDSKVNKGMTSLVVNLSNPALILGSLSATGSITQDNVFTLWYRILYPSPCYGVSFCPRHAGAKR